MTSLFDLMGKVALIVGGTGGIGRALSLGLAEYGADVIVASRRLDHLEEVAKEIHALGRKTMAISVDITDEKSVADMVENILKRFPRVMQPTVLVRERWML